MFPRVTLTCAGTNTQLHSSRLALTACWWRSALIGCPLVVGFSADAPPQVGSHSNSQRNKAVAMVIQSQQLAADMTSDTGHMTTQQLATKQRHTHTHTHQSLLRASALLASVRFTVATAAVRELFLDPEL